MSKPHNEGFSSADKLPVPSSDFTLFDSGPLEAVDSEWVRRNSLPVDEAKGRSTDSSIMYAISGELKEYVDKDEDPIIIRFKQYLTGLEKSLSEQMWDNFMKLVYSKVVDFKQNAARSNKHDLKYINPALNFIGETLVCEFMKNEVEKFFLELDRVNNEREIVERAIKFALGEVKIDGFNGGAGLSPAEKMQLIESYLIEGVASSTKEINVGTVLAIKPHFSRKGHFLKKAKEAREAEVPLLLMNVDLVGADQIDDKIVYHNLLAHLSQLLKAFAEIGQKSHVMVFAEEGQSVNLDFMALGLDLKEAERRAIDLCRQLENIIKLKFDKWDLSPKIVLGCVEASSLQEAAVGAFEDCVMTFVDETTEVASMVDIKGVLSPSGVIYEVGAIIEDNFAYWLQVLAANASNEQDLMRKLIVYLQNNYGGVFPKTAADLLGGDSRRSIAFSPKELISEYEEESGIEEKVERALREMPEFDIDVALGDLDFAPNTDPEGSVESTTPVRFVPVEEVDEITQVVEWGETQVLPNGIEARLRRISNRVRQVPSTLNGVPEDLNKDVPDDVYIDPEELEIGSNIHLSPEYLIDIQNADKK